MHQASSGSLVQFLPLSTGFLALRNECHVIQSPYPHQDQDNPGGSGSKHLIPKAPVQWRPSVFPAGQPPDSVNGGENLPKDLLPLSAVLHDNQQSKAFQIAQCSKREERRAFILLVQGLLSLQKLEKRVVLVMKSLRDISVSSDMSLVQLDPVLAVNLTHSHDSGFRRAEAVVFSTVESAKNDLSARIFR